MTKYVVYLLALTAFLSTGARANLVGKKLSFDGCQEDGWRISDVTIDSSNDTLTITSDIAHGTTVSTTVHKATIVLAHCDEMYRCTNVSSITTADINCYNDTTLTTQDRDACDVAKVIAEWETKTGDFSSRWNKGEFPMDQDACVIYDNEEIDPDGLDSDDDLVKSPGYNDASQLAPRQVITTIFPIVIIGCSLLY